MSFLPIARAKFLNCLFKHLTLSSLFLFSIPALKAKDLPQRIYILVAERLPDGAGDVALNIRSAQMLQDQLSFAQTEVILLVPESAQSTVDALLDETSTLKQISLKDTPNLAPADFLYSFSQHQERSELPSYVLNAAKHHFIYKDHAENGFYIHYSAHQAPYSLKELETQLIALGHSEAKDLQHGRIALAYTFNKIPSEAYMWAIAREAASKPDKKFFLFAKDSFQLSEFSTKLPPNLTLISHSTLPLAVHESAIAHSHLPILVTGLASINIALDYKRPLFYENRIHTHVTWRSVVNALTPIIANDELIYDLKRRGFNSEGVRSYAPSDTETLIATNEHPSLVDYFYEGLGNERINRLFHTPQTQIRSKHSLSLRWLRHIQLAYALEKQAQFQHVRSHNQGLVEILSQGENHKKSLHIFMEHTLHPALVQNSIFFTGFLDDFLKAFSLVNIKNFSYPDFFISDLMIYLNTMLKVELHSQEFAGSDLLVKWKERIFQLLILEEGTEFLDQMIPLWKKHAQLRPNNRMLNDLLKIKEKNKIKAYMRWLKSEELQRKLQGKSRLEQIYLKCKAWLSR